MYICIIYLYTTLHIILSWAAPTAGPCAGAKLRAKPLETLVGLPGATPHCATTVEGGEADDNRVPVGIPDKMQRAFRIDFRGASAEKGLRPYVQKYKSNICVHVYIYIYIYIYIYVLCC